MTSAGRWIGHSMGLFFVVLGAGFLALALSNGFIDAIAGTGNCSTFSCADSGARGTFLIVGVSFIAGGLVTSVLTEWSVRKVARIMRGVSEFTTSGAETPEALNHILKDFGISLDPASKARVNVQTRTIDLRSERRSRDVPTTPGGLSDYLKSVGVSIDPDLLSRAKIVRTGDQPGEQAGAASGAAQPERTRDESELRRERATIVRKKDRGETTGEQRLLELEIEVQPVGRVPYRVQLASLVRGSLASLLIEGSNLNVRVDPANENDVTIDWSEN